MLVSLNWLQKYVALPDDTSKLVDDLTMAGLNVEGLSSHGVEDPNVVVGYVLHVEPHPNADRLRKCRVRVADGDERDIVCGAPNVADGQHVFVALPGAKLPNGIKIRKSKIRGEASDGMICSEIELGLGEDAAGIMVLDGALAVGTPIAEVLGPGDSIIEIEVTPNRPDQLSHVGIAREVAAIYGTPLKLPYGGDYPIPGAARFEVEIADAADCARFVGKLITGVKVGPSPAWLAGALQAIGLQSINNIVDVTNFVLMETGQPIHAFDYRALKGPKIVVRRAQAGEKLFALDGKTYDLDDGVLAIADARDVVALAGIMGGEETAVHDDTVDVLIESANFNATLVRRGRTRLGMSTDASYRFERGADVEMCRIAAERAADLILQVAGGERSDVVDRYPQPRAQQLLSIRRTATRRILGANLSCEEIESHLARLGFTTLERTEEAVTVEVPSHRLDIVEEIDLIEEVARMYGYDRIGQGWDYRCSAFAVSDPYDEFAASLSDHLVARGFTEIMTSSFTDGSEMDDFDWPGSDQRRRPIAIRNPLTSQHLYLKTSLLPGMLETVRHNIDHGTRRLRLYQLGRVYLAPEGASQLPNEIPMAGLVITEPDSADFWRFSKQTLDLFVLKEEIEVLLRSLKVDLSGDDCYAFDRATGRFTYTRQNRTVIDGGVLSDRVSERYGFEQPIWFATIDLLALYESRPAAAKHKPLWGFPASKRDLSLVAAATVSYAEIEKSLVKAGGRLLESVQVFDVYRGDQLEGGKTAYGVRLHFRSPERTLTDPEVDDIIEKILSKLGTDLGVELRA